MKKIISYLLLAGLAGGLIARAQTGTAAPGQPVDNTNTAVAAAPEATNAPATTNPPPTTPAPAVADTNAAATGSATVTSNSVLNAASATNAPAAAPENIPLIQFSDVPITTAIEHLARQASINYMLDPKIGYGQPDQSGQIKPEPQLSIRWENITAESALLALLDNYGLQLVVDKKTGIDRVALKDPLAPPPLITRVVQLQYASVSNMARPCSRFWATSAAASCRTSAPASCWWWPPSQNSSRWTRWSPQLDKPTRQVLIETKLIEISSNPDRQARRGLEFHLERPTRHLRQWLCLRPPLTPSPLPARNHHDHHYSRRRPHYGYPTTAPSAEFQAPDSSHRQRRLVREHHQRLDFRHRVF